MIKVFNNCLSDDMCDYYINKINNVKKYVKEHYKLINDKMYNDKLSKYLKDFIKDEIKNCDKISHLFFFNSFKENQNMYVHQDIFIKTNAEYTKYVIVLYLNDDFIGGKTRFYNNFKIFKEIQPVKGSILVFDIKLYHDVEKVLSGCKYSMGTEIYVDV